MPGIGIGKGLHFGRFGGLATYKNQMGFWAGDLDFENSLWLDQSDNGNDADLVGGYCVSFINDVTITLQDPKIGAIVSELNGGVDTTGVTVNGSGHIEIDQSLLTNPKVWNILLNDGTEIRFTSGVGPFVFYDGNYGAIGGVETTDWDWSTTNDAFLNLQHGCSKYAYVNEGTKLSFGLSRVYQTKERPFELLWEGYLFETNANLCGIDLFPETYGYSLFYATGSRIVFANRETGYVSPRYNNGDSDVVGGWIKIKITYNGGGYENLSSWKMYLNDEEKVIIDGGADTSSRTKFTWAGHETADPLCAIKNQYFKRGNRLWQPVLNGRHVSNYGDAPDGYLHIPATGSLDWMGQSALNPSFEDSHNGCEAKIKLPEVTALQTADAYNYLFEIGGAAKEKDITEFYPNLNDVIQVNIQGNKYKDFIVMTTAVDLYLLLNGLKPRQLYCSFRTDSSGEGDVEAPLDYLVSEEQDVAFDVHTTYPISIGANYRPLLSNNKLAMSIHYFNPAFWKYATYEEGKYHFDNVATAGEISSGVVIENMGRIGYTYGIYNTPKEDIESLFALFGKAYPGGIPPATDDNNEDWWEWVIQVYAEHIATNGGVLSGMTSLGALPVGLLFTYNDGVRKAMNRYIIGSSFGKGELEAADDLANSISIFTGSVNGSIVDDGGVNCQRLNGSVSEAHGYFGIGSDNSWEDARNIVVEFDIKQTAGTAIPFPTICHGFFGPAEIIKPSGANIVFTGASVDTYVNPMSANLWYRIKLVWNENYIHFLIFDSSGDCILMSDEFFMSAQRSPAWYLRAIDSDILIKNVSVYASFYRNFYEFLSNQKWDNSSAYTNETVVEWIDRANNLMMDSAFFGNQVPTLFSHYIQNPTIKDPDGTEVGVIQHRSYEGFSSVFNFLKGIGFVDLNSRNVFDIITQATKRNLILAGDFIGTYEGITKAGSVPFGTTNVTIDVGEVANSIDGTNVVLLSNGNNCSMRFIIPEEGWYLLKLYAKGDITITIDNDLLSDAADIVSDTNRFINVGYELIQFPVYLNNNHKGEINIKAQADSWIHKACMYKI